MEEHWKLKGDGSLAGVYAVDPLKEFSRDKWKHIEDAMAAWVRLHPQEMAEHLLAVEYERQAQAKSGWSQMRSMKYGCSVPIGLARMLELIEPDLFSNRKLLNQFTRKFPAFKI